MKHFTRLIMFRAYSDLKSDAGRYYAGFLWWIFEPIIFMLTFYVVFGLFFKRGGENFVPSLLCGLTVWKWFAASFSQGATSILSQRQLLQVIYLKKIFFPAASLFSNLIRFLIVFLLLLIFYVCYGIYPNITWLGLPFIMLFQFLFIIGCATLASAIIPFFPDLTQLIDKALTLLLFMSGVFFDVTGLPPKIQAYLNFNPMAVIITSYRHVFLNQQWPDWPRLCVIGVISIAITMVGLFFLNKFDHLYPKLSV